MILRQPKIRWPKLKTPAIRILRQANKQRLRSQTANEQLRKIRQFLETRNMEELSPRRCYFRQRAMARAMRGAVLFHFAQNSRPIGIAGLVIGTFTSTFLGGGEG